MPDVRDKTKTLDNSGAGYTIWRFWILASWNEDLFWIHTFLRKTTFIFLFI